MTIVTCQAPFAHRAPHPRQEACCIIWVHAAELVNEFAHHFQQLADLA
jgi:hypothetical protein